MFAESQLFKASSLELVGLCPVPVLFIPARLKGYPKDYSWTPEMDSALTFAKSSLASVPDLVHPDPSPKIFLAVDALDSHVGAVFQQLV